MYYFAPCSDAQSFPGQGHFFKSLKVSISKEPFDLFSFRHYEPWRGIVCTSTHVCKHTCAYTHRCVHTEMHTYIHPIIEYFPAFLYHW